MLPAWSGELDGPLLSEAWTVDPVRGGFSGAVVWKVTSPERRAWSLKCWPSEGPDEARLIGIAELLRRASEECGEWIAVPCPTVFDGMPFHRQADRLWQLQPWLDGVAAGANGFVPGVFREAVARIVQLHGCWNPAPSAANGQRTGVPQSMRQRLEGLAMVGERVDAIMRMADSAGEASGCFRPVTREPGIGRLACRAALAIAPQLLERGRRLLRPAWIVQPVLTDLWRENLLFGDGRLTGIIDYGSLREDLIEAVWARFLGSLDLNSTPGWDTGAPGGDNLETAWSMVEAACAGQIECNREGGEIMGFLDAAGTVLGCLQWIDPLSVQNRFAATSMAARQRAVELMRKTIDLAYPKR